MGPSPGVQISPRAITKPDYFCHKQELELSMKKIIAFGEPLVGIEPMTYALPMRRYTPKPQWQYVSDLTLDYNHYDYSYWLLDFCRNEVRTLLKNIKIAN